MHWQSRMFTFALLKENRHILIFCSRLLPHIAKNTVGLVAVGTRKYFDWLTALVRFVVYSFTCAYPDGQCPISYVALFGWTLVIWVSFTPLIINNESPGGNAQISFIVKLLFGLVLCSSLLLFEKFSIQWIAAKFHERSYAGKCEKQYIQTHARLLLIIEQRGLLTRSWL